MGHSQIFKHHAYVSEGGKHTFQSLVRELESGFNIMFPHIDVTIFDFEDKKMGIDDAHRIRETVLLKPINAHPGYNIIIIHTAGIGTEAQNALLKSFEEPPAHTKIFLHVPRLDSLLDTLISRTVKLDITADEASGFAHVQTEADKLQQELLNAERFLGSTLSQRLSMVTDIHSAMDKERVSIGQIFDFIDAIESLVHASCIAKITDDAVSGGAVIDKYPVKDKVLEAVQFVQSNIANQGSSTKMLLEYLALHLD